MRGIVTLCSEEETSIKHVSGGLEGFGPPDSPQNTWGGGGHNFVKFSCLSDSKSEFGFLMTSIGKTLPHFEPPKVTVVTRYNPGSCTIASQHGAEEGCTQVR